MNINEGEQHNNILSNNRVGNNNVIISLLSFVMSGWGFFLIALLIAGAVCYAFIDVHSFAVFMKNFFVWAIWFIGVAVVCYLIHFVIRHILGGIIEHIIGKFIKHVVEPLRKDRVEFANENFVAHVGNVTVTAHHDDKYVYNYKQELPLGQLQLPPPASVAQPTQEYAISQLKENGLQVCLGVSATTQQPFVIDLIDGTHYRIIGASGMGKSCFAGSILDQATKTNSPDMLQIALLDLEHKTSRLFEALPHVAELRVGRKLVECVAATPDEVGEHFGYLRKELDRRKELSEYDLQRERFMLIYVEEFLSLKREIDPKLKQQMLDDFSILAIRGRKYKLYLLACAQVDYSDAQLREAQGQFNVNASFAVKPRAAQAAGFSNFPLLKQNFEDRQRGKMVLETTNISDIMLAPQFDVKQKLMALERSNNGAITRVLDDDQHQNFVDSHLVNTEVTPTLAPALEAKLPQVADMLARHYNQTEIIEKVWQCSKGTNAKYYQARAEYLQLVNMIRQRQAHIELGA